jgi:hypothetical protein
MSIAAVLIASHDAFALVLLHDEFLETGPLAGKFPMPGPSSTTAWNAGAQTGVNAVTVVNTSASPVNNEVALIQTEAANGEDIAYVFGDQATTAVTYGRFDFSLPATDNTTLATDLDIQTEGLFFVTLRGTSASTSQRARVGFVPPATSGYRIAINADNGNLVSGAVFPQDLAFDTMYRAVFSFDASTATSKLWIDPTDESSLSIVHTGVATSIGTIINRIILRQHNTYNGKVLVDGVVVGTSFADVLNPPAGVPGDYNGNGAVDAADYVLWRKGGPLANEVDTPGTVNDADYTEWRARFGNPSAVGAAVASVPEPASTSLLILAAAFAALRRNKHR